MLPIARAACQPSVTPSDRRSVENESCRDGRYRGSVSRTRPSHSVPPAAPGWLMLTSRMNDRTGRLFGLVLAGALIGYGLTPFLSSGWLLIPGVNPLLSNGVVLVGAGVVLGAVCSLGVPWRDTARRLVVGLSAGVIVTLVLLLRTLG